MNRAFVYFKHVIIQSLAFITILFNLYLNPMPFENMI